MLLFPKLVPSARFEATMMNPTLQEDSMLAQFFSFDYDFYYFN
jgi:hypothetical protein